jgi:hypothetical protein
VVPFFPSLSVEPKSGKQSAMSIAFGFRVLKFSFQMDLFLYCILFIILKKGKNFAACIINYHTLMIGSGKQKFKPLNFHFLQRGFPWLHLSNN